MDTNHFTPAGVDLAVALAFVAERLPFAPHVLDVASAYASGALTESGLIAEAEQLAERSDVIANAVQRWKARTIETTSGADWRAAESDHASRVHAEAVAEHRDACEGGGQ